KIRDKGLYHSSLFMYSSMEVTVKEWRYVCRIRDDDVTKYFVRSDCTHSSNTRRIRLFGADRSVGLVEHSVRIDCTNHRLDRVVRESDRAFVYYKHPTRSIEDSI